MNRRIPEIFLGIACGVGSCIAMPVNAEALDPSQLLGCYAQSVDGSVSLRISQEDDRYTASSIQEGQWGNPSELIPLSEEQLDKMGPEMKGILVAMLSGKLGIPAFVRVKKGATIQGMTAESEFLLIAPQVGGPLFPRECPD